MVLIYLMLMVIIVFGVKGIIHFCLLRIFCPTNRDIFSANLVLNKNISKSVSKDVGEG